MFGLTVQTTRKRKNLARKRKKKRRKKRKGHRGQKQSTEERRRRRERHMAREPCGDNAAQHPPRPSGTVVRMSSGAESLLPYTMFQGRPPPSPQLPVSALPASACCSMHVFLQPRSRDFLSGWKLWCFLQVRGFGASRDQHTTALSRCGNRACQHI